MPGQVHTRMHILVIPPQTSISSWSLRGFGAHSPQDGSPGGLPWRLTSPDLPWHSCLHSSQNCVLCLPILSYDHRVVQTCSNRGDMHAHITTSNPNSSDLLHSQNKNTLQNTNLVRPPCPSKSFTGSARTERKPPVHFTCWGPKAQCDVMVFGDGGLGRCLGLYEVTRVGLGMRCDHGGHRALKRRWLKRVPPPTLWRHSETVAICKPGLSLETESSSTSTLDFQASGTAWNKGVLLKHPSL